MDTLETQARFFTPDAFVEQDYRAVYIDEDLFIGSQYDLERIVSNLVRPGSAIIVGAQFGDEGKGAMIDRKIAELLKIRGINLVYVIRYQGGSNAGHTVYSPDGQKVPLHQIPSSIMYMETVGIMDSGMIIHLEDLRTEIEDAEAVVGDLRNRLLLSPEAMLATDLERAEELFNRFLSSGNADGGTGRGISPAVAGRIDRTGHSIADLLDENWEVTFRKKYLQLEVAMQAEADFPFSLADIEVPNLKGIRTDVNPKTKVGTVDEFIDRMADVRTWLIQREMVTNTFMLHHQAFNDLSKGILFEGSQAIGLHPFLGRYPDVTATDTTVQGVNTTQLWIDDNIEEKIGVFKLTYQSSVGSARMITNIDLPRTALTEDELAGLDEDQQYGNRVRVDAHERGTTTKRYRDICYLDMELMRYNCRMGKIEALAATHLDIAYEDTEIKVCTHYTDLQGNRVPYQPGVKHQAGLIPHYVSLPGWSGEAARNAKNYDELPLNAQKYLAFVQRSLGIPIVLATNGPERQHLIDFEA